VGVPESPAISPRFRDALAGIDQRTLELIARGACLDVRTAPMRTRRNPAINADGLPE
jgi:hypothetical protein